MKKQKGSKGNPTNQSFGELANFFFGDDLVRSDPYLLERSARRPS